MKILFTSLIASSVALIHVLDNMGRVSTGFEQAKLRAISILNTKDVRISGLKRVPREEIERSLPYSRSVGWWMLNETAIKARVGENPWVRKVEIQHCQDGIMPSFGCFALKIEEREPRFIALVDNERWIISEDGALITPARGELPGISDQTLLALVPIYGLASRVAAPERSKAQLEFAQSAIRILELSAQRRVQSIAFQGRADIAVALEGLPFEVIFGPHTVDSVTVLEDQGLRLKALLPELKERIPQIEKIDLAFSKVGVVKFKPLEAPVGK